MGHHELAATTPGSKSTMLTWLSTLLSVILWGCLHSEVTATNNTHVVYVADTKRHGVYRVELFVNGGEKRLPLNFDVPVAVAHDVTSGNVYITERGRDSVRSRKYIYKWDQGRQQTAKVELPRWSAPDGLAVDPISQLVYYSDATNDVIGVYTADLHHGRPILYDDLGQPRGLALDPIKGLLFWTDWQKSSPHIGRANMDGSNRTSIVTTDLTTPNGLALDRTEGRLYWCDAIRDVIESCLTDGSARRLVHRLPSNSHCFGVAVDDTFIYWTDWKKTGVQRILKNGTGPTITLGPHHDLDEVQLMGLVLGGTDWSQNETTACSGADRGGCAHLCVPTARGRTCLCDEGFLLGDDNTSCRPVDFRSGLLVADAGRKELLAYDMPTNTSMRLPYPRGHGNPVGVAYDSNEHYVFWVDSGLHRITRGCFFNVSCPTKDLHTYTARSNSQLVGITLDPLRREVYVADRGLYSITRMDYDGGSQTLVHSLPGVVLNDVAMDPDHRVLYWAEGGQSARIMMSDATTVHSIPQVLVSEVSLPKALALDAAGGRMYWVDVNRKTLESVFLNGTDRRIVREFQRQTPVSALTMGGSSLYWTFTDDRSIHALDLTTLTTKTYRSSSFQNIVSMAFFHRGPSQPPQQDLNIPGETYTPGPIPATESKSTFPLPVILGVVAAVVLIIIIVTVAVRRKRRKPKARPCLPVINMMPMDEYLHPPAPPPSEDGISHESDTIYSEIDDLKARPLPPVPTPYLSAAADNPVFTFRSSSPIPRIPSPIPQIPSPIPPTSAPSPIPAIPTPKASPSATSKTTPSGAKKGSGKHPVPKPRGIKKQSPSEDERYTNLKHGKDNPASENYMFAQQENDNGTEENYMNAQQENAHNSQENYMNVPRGDEGQPQENYMNVPHWEDTNRPFYTPLIP